MRIEPGERLKALGPEPLHEVVGVTQIDIPHVFAPKSLLPLNDPNHPVAAK